MVAIANPALTIRFLVFIWIIFVFFTELAAFVSFVESLGIELLFATERVSVIVEPVIVPEVFASATPTIFRPLSAYRDVVFEAVESERTYISLFVFLGFFEEFLKFEVLFEAMILCQF